jgi:cyclohexanone monooxygenase
MKGRFTGLRVSISTGSSAIQSIGTPASIRADGVSAHRDLHHAGLERKLTPEYRNAIRPTTTGAKPGTPDRPISVQHEASTRSHARARGNMKSLATRRAAFPRRRPLLLRKRQRHHRQIRARQIRSIVKDPVTARRYAPIACSAASACASTGYFETYNLPRVKLVDVGDTDQRFTAAASR